MSPKPSVLGRKVKNTKRTPPAPGKTVRYRVWVLPTARTADTVRCTPEQTALEQRILVRVALDDGIDGALEATGHAVLVHRGHQYAACSLAPLSSVTLY
jgi:hypothetical protein